MLSNIHDPVSSKFYELLQSLKYFSDDLKIACAEASLEGDFARIAIISDSAKQVQEFVNDVDALSSRWSKGLKTPSAPKKVLVKPKRSYSKKKPRSKIQVTINGQQVQLNTAADTFVEVLKTIGFERVANLNKKLSGISLICKTPPTGYQTTKQSGPWFISTHSSTRNMKKLLEEIGRDVKEPIQVKILESQL
jgi:hypothetical protein